MRSPVLFKYIKLLLCASFFVSLPLSGIRAQSNERQTAIYTEADGLSSSITRCVLQDARGMLWIGTPEGLHYYDGYTFKIFRKSSVDPNTLRDNFITKLAEDTAGDIWMGYQQGGVSAYNISTGIFRHYPLKEYSDTDHIKMPQVTMLFVDQENNIWIGIARSGIYKLDKQTGKYAQFDLIDENGTPFNTAPNKIYNTAYAASEDKTGRLWLATAAGLCDFRPRSNYMKIHRNAPLKAGDINREHYTYIERKADKLWMGAWTGGLVSYDPATDQWDYFMHSPLSQPNTIIKDIHVDSGDSILLISDDRGLGYFNIRSREFSFPEENDHIKGGIYRSIYKDRSANIWITGSRGLIKIRKAPPKFYFRPLTNPENSSDMFCSVNAIFENAHFLILGASCYHGLHVRHKATGKEQTIRFETPAGEEQVSDILQDIRGTIWVLTLDHLYALDVTTMQLKKRNGPASPADNKRSYFFRMQEGGDGRLWIASLRNGLFLYDALNDAMVRHYTPENAQNSFIPTFCVMGLFRDAKGMVWIGGEDGFLGSVDERSGLTHSYRTYFPKEDVNINTVYDIINVDGHTIWVGTDAGLMKYGVEGDQLRLQNAYTSENGIASDIVKSIARPGDGSIWCITSTSLCRFDPSTGTVINYGFNDGLQNPGIGERIQAISNSKIALGTVSGYYMFDPVHIAQMQQPAPILITSFAVNGQLRNYTSELAAKGIVNLEPSENRISFEFASINFNNTGKQQYAYMLEGLDTKWAITYNRYAGYVNLQPGNYTFKLRAIGGADQQDSETIAVPLYVSGYFYKSAWFKILLGAVLSGAVYLVYSIRLRHQKRMLQLQAKASLLEKEKTMIMYENLRQQLNPHFLFNSLASLSSLIRINQKLAGEFLDGLSNIYRYILNSRDKELVSLSEEVRFCKTYIKLQQTRFREALKVSFNIKEEHLHMKLPAVTLQNMLENAIKHNIVTEEDPLVVDISTNESSQLVIANNLNKKNFVETSNRKGLASLRALYAYLSDQPIEIIETPHRFTIKIPLM